MNCVCLFVGLVLATRMTSASSWARDGIRAIAATYTTAAAMLDPEPTVLGSASNPHHRRDNPRSLTYCTTAETPCVCPKSGCLVSLAGHASPALEREMPLCSLMNLSSVCLGWEECSKAWGSSSVASCQDLKVGPVLGL